MTFSRQRGAIGTLAGMMALSLFSLTASALPLSAQQSSKTAAGPTTGRIGTVKLVYDHMEGQIASGPDGKSRLLLSGPHTLIQSDLYSIAAPRIDATFNRQNILESGIATGGVRVEVRDTPASAAAGGTAASSDAGTTTVVTCDTAHFTRLRNPDGNPTGRSQIVMEGHVRSKTFNKAFSEPLINDSESATIEFGGNKQTTISWQNGSATVTPREPAAAAAPPTKSAEKKK